MTASLVLDPDAGFTDLSQRFGQAGWQLVGRAANPIVPDEPEHAIFERGAERVFYSFNPVCRLRVLDVSSLTDPACLPLLPAIGKEKVQHWLASPDERSVLRGILAAGVLGAASLARDVQAHQRHPRASIAGAAARTAQALSGSAMPTATDAEHAAQAQAMAAIDVLRAQLQPLLMALGQDRDGTLHATLRPHPDDCERAFQPHVAEAARQAYEAVWSTPPRVTRATPGSQIQCHIAPAGMLGHDNTLSWHFPGGYCAIAPLLQPQRVWAAWKLIEPGHSAGMSYDGLVWLDHHWAWFPKPYRILAHLVDARRD